jgi:hypothetical protein
MWSVKRRLALIPALLALFLYASCSKKTIGWGVLLWHIAEPDIPSGTVLPIQVRSNIQQAWIARLPEGFSADKNAFVEVPLPHLEFFRTRGRAEKYREGFSEYARVYAETIQDGLPIRDKPENNARRTYRLKEGEVIKILEKVEGVAAISAAGDPLEGDWFLVLTQSGSTGYCFSYRLKLFEHSAGPLENRPVEANTGGDRELELVLTRTWYPEIYGTMVNSGRIHIDTLARNYSFTAGINRGRARIYLEQADISFPYRKIVKTGDHSWNFDGTPLTVTLRSESAVEVRWEDGEGTARTETFVTLPLSVENIISREKERREGQFQALYVRGPAFESPNYGVLTLGSGGRFTWDGVESLPEEILPPSILGSGTVDMDYYLTGDLAERYTGALALRFDSAVEGRSMVFAYTLDNQGLRMEHIPADHAAGRTISRRSSPPFVIYFTAES